MAILKEGEAGLAEEITEDWLRVYNEQRSHDALGGLPPKQLPPRLTTAAESGNQLST